MARESSKKNKDNNFDEGGQAEEFDREEFRPDAANFKPAKFLNPNKRAMNSSSKKEKSAPNIRSDDYEADLVQSKEETRSHHAGTKNNAYGKPLRVYAVDEVQAHPSMPDKNAGYLERYSSKKRFLKQQ